jgi:hypothetical protein
LPKKKVNREIMTLHLTQLVAWCVISVYVPDICFQSSGRVISIEVSRSSAAVSGHVVLIRSIWCGIPRYSRYQPEAMTVS